MVVSRDKNELGPRKHERSEYTRISGCLTTWTRQYIARGDSDPIPSRQSARVSCHGDTDIVAGWVLVAQRGLRGDGYGECHARREEKRRRENWGHSGDCCCHGALHLGDIYLTFWRAPNTPSVAERWVTR